jgi:hypothetical protein
MIDNIVRAVRKPEPPPVTWADAPAYTAMGYEVLPIEARQVEDGHEVPFGGGWAWGLGEVPESAHASTAVGILCGRQPRGNVGLDDVAARWVVALRIKIHSNKKLSQEIERLVRPRLHWSDEATARHAPVRLTPHSRELLMVFRFEGADPRSLYSLSTRPFDAPGDRPYADYNVVSLEASGQCFVADGIVGGKPYTWRDGLSLRAVHRNDLPIMTTDDAHEMYEAIETLLQERCGY